MGEMTHPQDATQQQSWFVITITLPGGALQVRGVGVPLLSDEVETALIDTYRGFAEDFQMMVAWYAGILRSRGAMLSTMRDLALCGKPLIVTTFGPDGSEGPVLAEVPTKRVVASIADAGEFERQFAKTVVVNTFTAWDHGARPALADILRVRRCDITSDLMGEWRRLRNWLVHPVQGTEDDYFAEAPTLVQALGSTRGAPTVTAVDVATLAGLLNNMSINVDIGKS